MSLYGMQNSKVIFLPDVSSSSKVLSITYTKARYKVQFSKSSVYYPEIIQRLTSLSLSSKLCRVMFPPDFSLNSYIFYPPYKVYEKYL